MKAAYPRTYNAIREMARRAMLEVKMARGIARKAGLRSRPQESEPTDVRGPAVLLVMDGADGTPRAEDSEPGYAVRYRDVIYDTGMGDMGGTTTLDDPYSYAVPVHGLYRIDVACGVWRDDFSEHDREYLGLAFYRNTDIFYQSAEIARDIVYPSLSRSTSVPSVYGGYTYAVLLADMRITLFVNRNWSQLPGYYTSGIETQPDATYSRMGIQLIREIVE